MALLPCGTRVRLNDECRANLRGLQGTIISNSTVFPYVVLLDDPNAPIGTYEKLSQRYPFYKGDRTTGWCYSSAEAFDVLPGSVTHEISLMIMEEHEDVP